MTNSIDYTMVPCWNGIRTTVGKPGQIVLYGDLRQFEDLPSTGHGRTTTITIARRQNPGGGLLRIKSTIARAVVTRDKCEEQIALLQRAIAVYDNQRVPDYGRMWKFPSKIASKRDWEDVRRFVELQEGCT